MKKTLRLIAAVMALAVAAVSCGPDPVPDDPTPVDPTPVDPVPDPTVKFTFKATFAPESTYDITEWKAGDEIVLLAIGSSEFRLDTLKAANGGASAEFTSEGVLPKDAKDFYAYIPGTGVAGFTQAMYWESEPVSGCAPAFVVAASKDTNLVFKGLFPLLSVKVEDAEAATVELSGNNGEVIDETVLVSFEDMAVKSSGASLSPNVLSRAVSGPDSLVFALKPGLELASGYTIKVLDANGALVSKSVVTDPVTFAQSTRYNAPTPVRERSYGKTTTFDPSKVKYTFGIISDTHIDGAATATAEKLKNALQQIKSKALESDQDGVDAILVAGDLINSPYTSGSYTEATYFKSIYESVYDPTKVPMIYTIGNHDVYGQWTSSMVSNAANISKIFGDNYFKTDLDNEMRTKYECRHCVVGDYHVLCISPTSKASPSAGYDPAAISWLDEQLKSITEADPDRYVFVLTHPMIYNTVYGSDLLYGTLAWYTSALTPTLQKYPQVLAFGGHLHFPLNDPRNIWQGDFTVFGTGSTRYMAIENGGYVDMAGATTMKDNAEFSEGYVFQIDGSGNVRVVRMDFYRSQEIGEYQELTYPQTDLSHLRPYSHITRAAANQAPTVSKVEAVKTVSGWTAKWAKASDDEFAHHYVATLTKDGAAFSTYKVLADFYRNPKKETMKDEYSLYLGALASGNYVLSVVAYDSWGAASNTCSTSFTVESSSSAPKAELYVDIDFAEGSVKDAKNHATLQNVNSKIAKTTVSHGGQSASVYAASFTGDNYIAGVLSEITSFSAMQGFAANSFSVEAFYVDKAPGSAVHAVFCATEMGGWGMAVRATGVPYFIVGDAAYNKYIAADATAVASKTDLTHVVCVYDATTKLISIYVNGKLNKSTSITGPFYPGKGDTYNRFIIGGDTKDGAVYGDFKPTNMVVVDAKLYTGALTSTEITAAYNAAVAALK